MADRTDHARSSASSNPVRVRFDRFELDEANARLSRDGAAIALAPTPFAVLCALVRQPGSLLTTNALLDDVWGHRFVTDSVLRTAISELRTALDDDARKPRFIETVSRRGYRFLGTPGAIPAAPGVQPHDTGFAAAHAPSFIGRAEPLSWLRRAWDIACSGKRAVVWIAGEPGIGKTTLIEQFIANLGDVACAHGQCVDHYGTGESVSSCSGSARGAVPQRQRGSVLAARRGTDLAACSCRGSARGRARSATTRARRRQPGSHAARDGPVPRSLRASIARCCW